MLKPSLDREGKVWEVMELQTKGTLPTLLEMNEAQLREVAGFRQMKHTALIPGDGQQVSRFLKGDLITLKTKKVQEIFDLMKNGYQCYAYIGEFSAGVQDETKGFDFGMIVRYRLMVILVQEVETNPASGAWWFPPVMVDETEFLGSSLFTANQMKVETTQEVAIG